MKQGSFVADAAFGQTPQLDKAESTPGCRDSYGPILARPAPPADHREIGWLQGELLPIFCCPALWPSELTQTDGDRSNAEQHQEGTGAPRAASVGWPRPGRVIPLSEGLTT